MSGGRKRKLLYVVTEDWYFVSHRLALAKAARDAGFEVSVSTRPGRSTEPIRDAGLNLVPLDFQRSGLQPLKEAATIGSLTRIYRRERPDLVHHVAMKPVVYGGIAARIAGVPALVNALMGLGYVFSSSSAKARALRPVVSALLRPTLHRRASLTIVQNRDDLALLERQQLAPGGSIRLIPGSGVDLASYGSAPPPDGMPIVILPARLLRDKGVFEFAAAARQLRAEGVKARFALVGAPDRGNPASLTEQDLAALAAEGVVEVWGWRSDMPEVFRQASLVCLPSYYGEGLAKSLLEAAASSRAIVTTDMPGCRDAVRVGETGWLVPPRDVSSLAACLRDALAQPEALRRYGAAGRALVAANFTLDRIVGDTLALYDELLFPSRASG